MMYKFLLLLDLHLTQHHVYSKFQNRTHDEYEKHGFQAGITEYDTCF
jgi:hypothetical protein